MTKETAFFAFRRDNETVSCRGEDLKFTATQDDYFFLWRNGTVYKTRLAINPDRIESIVTEQVDLNYEGYAFVRDRDTGAKLAETSPPFANTQQELRVYEHIFDGNPDTKFKSYTNNGIRHDVVIQFPKPIDVYGSITIRAGFHNNKRLGEMLINGVVVRELSAWDSEPQDFTANYTGQINEFSIRQKELNNTQCTAVITYIDIDGERLVSDVNTSKIVMAVGTDMTKYKINMRIKKYNGTVIGKIGAVEENTRTIWLTEVQPFQAGDGIIIEQVVDDMIELSEVQSTDWFACTEQHSPTNHISYKVDGNRFVELFQEQSANFEVLSGNVRLNMRFAQTSTQVKVIRQEDRQEWVYSGSYTNHSLPVGNYFVPTLEAGGLQCIKLYGTGSNGNFEFKSNFDTSTVTNMAYFIGECKLFEGELNHLDFSNVTNLYRAFYLCEKFNSSISNFDLSNVDNFYQAFKSCPKFNQEIKHLDLSNARSVKESFSGCTALNQDVRGIKWKQGAVLDGTFSGCKAMNHPGLAVEFPFPAHVNLWRTTRYWSGFKQSISNWTQPLPWAISELFFGWSQFNQDVSHLDLSNVSRLEYTFGASAFNNDSFKNWDFTNSNLISIAGTFKSCNMVSTNQRILSNWDVSNIENMYGIFDQSALGKATNGSFDLSDWDTSNVKNLGRAFACSNMVEPKISNWNVSNVTNMMGTFKNSLIGEDLNSWDVRNVTNMSYIFEEYGTRIDPEALAWGYNTLDLQIDHWNPHSVNQFKYAFNNLGWAYGMTGKFDLWRWRMPNLEGSDYGYAWDDETNPKWHWYGQTEYYTGQVSTRPAFGLQPISPSYRPDYTIRLSTWAYNSRYNSDIGISNFSEVFTSHGDYSNGANESEWSVLNRAKKQSVIDVFGATNGNGVTFGRFYGRYDRDSSNWEFAEPFGYHPELVNNPSTTNMAFIFAAKGNMSNVTGFEHINTSNVTNMFRAFSNINQSSALGEVKISGWDVSNVNNMDSFFLSSVSNCITIGDLRSWCVQNVPSKPQQWPAKSEGIVEYDPCWGECPLPGEIGTCGGEPAGKPMPLGAWSLQHQQYYISIDDRVANRYDQWYLNLGRTCQLWRALRGTKDFSKRSNASYLWLDMTYDWIVTSRTSSDTIRFDITDGPFNFLGADTSNVTNMYEMFKGSVFNDDIGWWDTSNVRNMRNMFYDAGQFNQNLSGWDVSNVSCSRDYDRYAYSWSVNNKPNL